jgi:rubrerythrin
MFKYELDQAEKELIEYEALEMRYFFVQRGSRAFDWVAMEEARHEREVLALLTPELRKAYLRLCKATR